jgi:RimJ/RimL family protein N-acetyltransferase
MPSDTVTVKKSTGLTSDQLKDLIAMADRANKDPTLAGYVDNPSMAVFIGQELVGFFSPRKTSYQGKPHWRAGALWTEPKHRHKGVMKKALEEFFATHHPCLSWIEDTNGASIKLFLRLGFKKGPKRDLEDTPGHWYTKS